MAGKRQQRDPVSGLAMIRQAGLVPEEFLNNDGSFSLARFNAIIGEVCDVADVTSMAWLYNYSVSHLKKRVLPELDFVIRIGPVMLSCTNSLLADASIRVAEARERQREGGRLYGRGMPRQSDVSSRTLL